MLRIASYECQKYWRAIKRQLTILSLNTELNNGDGIELIDTVADDKAIDLDAWLDNKTFLLGCPMRLIQIAHKIRDGQTLTHGERTYLWKWRKREQRKLL